MPNQPGAANFLRQLLRGNVVAGNVPWSSTATCAFRGEHRFEGSSYSLQVEVGHGALPGKIVEELHSDQPGQPRQEYKLTYLPDFDQLPLIAAPGP